MSGAKVTEKSFRTTIWYKNGEIVEILTANTHGPSRDWLKICRTSQAKNKINQWFKREFKEDNIIRGKELLVLTARRRGS